LADFAIYIAEEFDKQLKKISKREKGLIEKKLKEYVMPQLKTEPHFCTNIKKLKNYDPSTWMYRIGNYRIFYLIDDEESEINIISISQRKDAY
jgi:mRNA interferase RelE/StbE